MAMKTEQEVMEEFERVERNVQRMEQNLRELDSSARGRDELARDIRWNRERLDFLRWVLNKGLSW